MENWEIDLIQKIQQNLPEYNPDMRHMEAKWQVVAAGLEEKKRGAWFWFRNVAAVLLVGMVSVLAFHYFNKNAVPNSMKLAAGAQKADIQNQSKVAELPQKLPVLNQNLDASVLHISPENLSDTPKIILPEQAPIFPIEESVAVTVPAEKNTVKTGRNAKKRKSKTIYLAGQKSTTKPESVVTTQGQSFWDTDNRGRHAEAAREDKNKIIKF